MPRRGAKERPSAEHSDVLSRNFDLSVIDHIRQLGIHTTVTPVEVVASVAAVT